MSNEIFIPASGKRMWRRTNPLEPRWLARYSQKLLYDIHIFTTLKRAKHYLYVHR